MRVALFGGSFDPPHAGHVLAMAYVLSVGRVDRLLMIPCFQHPFDKRLAPFAHRLAMSELAAATLSPRIEVTDVEARLGGDSKTLRTVKQLRSERPDDQLVLVIGSDLLSERERWFGYQELVTLVDFFVVGRQGHPAALGDDQPQVAIPDVSSTEIRARIRDGRSLDRLVPAAVVDYLADHAIYRETASEVVPP